jgi:copper homeostasis protein (lipoprotein)
MNRHLLLASLVAIALSTTACKREQPAKANATSPATDLAGAGVQPNAAGFTGKAFAGTFTATLPCADCPGIDETLELKPDGSFRLIDIYRERPQGTNTVAGSWTSEDDNKTLRLDPNTKAEPDRLYAIVSNDLITTLDRDGKPAQDASQSLHRSH